VSVKKNVLIIIGDVGMKIKQQIIFSIFIVTIILSLNFISARSCTYSYECSNGGDPIAISDEKATQYKCVNGQCVAEDFYIECASDAKCRDLYGDGYICDLAYNNYGNCIKSQGFVSPYCGDGDCDIGETRSNCPEDCDPNYQSQQTSSDGDNSILIGIIISVAIIIGFVILAIILKKKK